MNFCYIWQTYPSGIPKIELTDVKIQEQTASFGTFFRITIGPYRCVIPYDRIKVKV